MNVGIFYSSISNWQAPTSQHKTGTLKEFALGVKACGDTPVSHKDPSGVIENMDAAVILGYAIDKGFRHKIITNLKSKNIPIIFLDSNIFVYGKKDLRCYRYSVNGIYPTDGEYFLSLPRDSSKLNRILSMHDIEIKPWRQNGSHILILGQRTTSWNMLNRNILEWVTTTIEKIKQITDRPIRVRLHPGDLENNTSNINKLQKRFGNSITISTKLNNQNIINDFEDAWCSVGYNSTPNCASIMNGIPVYLEDPNNSWAKDVAFTDLNLIENPPMPDRTDWLHTIAHIHHTSEEITSGAYWRKYKEFYKTPVG